MKDDARQNKNSGDYKKGSYIRCKIWMIVEKPRTANIILYL